MGSSLPRALISQRYTDNGKRSEVSQTVIDTSRRSTAGQELVRPHTRKGRAQPPLAGLPGSSEQERAPSLPLRSHSLSEASRPSQPCHSH